MDVSIHHQLSLTALFLTLIWPTKADIEPILIKGSKFFYSSNHTQFFVRGVFYEVRDIHSVNATSAIDPLTNEPTCVRDIPHLLQLGINSIFVNYLSPDRDHSACMRLLNDAGIYVVAHLSYSGLDFQLNGEKYFSEDRALVENYARIINSMQKFSNTLGFYVRLWDTSAAKLEMIPVDKAIIRDLKEHIRVNGYRPIPIGVLGVNHGKSIFLSEYMCCGNGDIAADFYSLACPKWNAHDPESWCFNLTTISELDKLAEKYSNFPKPVILSYGVSNRIAQKFDEIRHIYSDRMTDVFSGAVANEWFSNQAIDGSSGLVDIYNGELRRQRSYLALSSQLATISPHTIQADDYIPIDKTVQCQNITMRNDKDSYINFGKDIKISSTLPTKTSPRLCSCMLQTLGCVADSRANTQIGEQTYSKLCNHAWCPGTRVNASEGIFDSYAMCNTTEKTSWVFHRQYLQSGNDSSACTSAGGILQKPKTPESLSNDCGILLRQAGPEGTGTVTLFPTATSAATSEFVEHSRSINMSAKLAIGISIGCLAILAITLFLCFRNRRRKSSYATSTKSEKNEYQKAELPSDNIATEKGETPLLDGVQVIELEASQPNELEANGMNEMESSEVVELDALERAELPVSQSVELEKTPTNLRKI